MMQGRTPGEPPTKPVTLGPLEMRLMKALWRLGGATVNEVLRAEKLSAAYTTVMTTLDRLHKKGLLRRVSEGRAFRYTPAQSEGEFHGAMLRSAVKRMLGATSAASTPISYLVEAVSEHDATLLDELEREIERKRRELQGNKK